MSQNLIALAFLDQNLHRCEEPAAKFTHSVEQKGTLADSKTLQTLSAFDSEMAQAAETLSQKTKFEPIGIASYPGESKEINGFGFVAVTTNGWVCQRRDCSIHLQATTDRIDTELLLAAIQPIEEKILKRNLAGKKPIEIHIGIHQWPTHHSIASASHHGDHRKIRFFTTENQSHLLASKLEQAVGIECSKVLLHEIGHGMDELMPRLRSALEQTVIAKLENAETFLKEISPDYLGKQFTSGGAADKAWRISDEIFAETVRTQYLEPCMLGELPPKHTKTNWDSLDKLVEYLHKEAALTLSAEQPSTPPFPPTDNRPEIN